MSIHFNPQRQLEQDIHLTLFDPMPLLPWYQREFPHELELFKWGGIHPEIQTPLRNPYTGNAETRDFRNIGEHCLAVAELARFLAEGLEAQGILTKEQVRHTISRALLHDVAKPYEIMRLEAEKLGLVREVHGEKALSELSSMLQQAGVAPKLADAIAFTGEEAGHCAIKDFFDPSQAVLTLKPGNFTAKIIHLADGMTYTGRPLDGKRAPTAYLPFSKREEHSQLAQKYPYLYNRGLALNSENVFYEVHTDECSREDITFVGTYIFLEQTLSTFVANELCYHLSLSGTEDPESRLLHSYQSTHSS